MKFSMKDAGLLALTAVPLVSPVAAALDFSVSGFIRQEMAYSISNDQNPFLRGSALVSGDVPNYLGQALGDPNAHFDKKDFDYDNDWNLMSTRAEIDFEIQISNNWSGFVKLRGYYSADVFDNKSVVEGANEPNQFKVDNHGQCATVFEVCDDDYMIDLPSFYLDYSKGPLWVRLGNQQIAWGESIFFRVLDVPNGLDLRRHSFLDFASEEYADERVSSPAIRVSYNLNDEWEIEAFAQMFQPTIWPQTGTPYAFVNSPFQIMNDEGFDKVDDKINFGVRLRGQLGDLGLQFMAMSRHNPDPVLKWAAGGQTGVMPGFETQPFRATNFPGARGAPNSGTYGAHDWLSVAALAGLDGVEALNVLGNDFAWIGGTLSAPVSAGGFGLTGPEYVSSVDEAKLTLDGFFTLLGDLEADLVPTYSEENVFGFGVNYIFYAEPDTFMDQLVVRFEATYTPDKRWTNNLSRDLIEEDEWVTGLAIEKYQKFSRRFPATFMVFQWMHKSQSDMLGRHLRNLGAYGVQRKATGGEEAHGWDAVAFAVQQPFPNLVWRLDLSVLYDFNGSYLVQPGVRYKPSGEWTVEVFANFLDSKDNAGTMAPLDWGDEVTARLTYQF